MNKKILALVAAAVLSIGMLAGCSQPTASGATKTVGTAVTGNEVEIEKAAMNLTSTVKAGGYSLVSTEELKGWVDSKKDMVIVDTMPASSFTGGHIPGAVNVELPKTGLKDATDEQKSAFLKSLGNDKNKTIVVYCGFVACGRSDVGAVIAKENGFKNVFRQPGGIIAWKDAKYDVAK